MRSLSLALLVPSPVLAATINVPTDQLTLADAIAASAPNDTIQLSAGTYDEEVTVGHTLTIESVPGEEATLVNTLGTGAILTVLPGTASITIRNLDFGPSVDRAIDSAALVVTLTDLTASGLTSSGRGGFLHATDPALVSVNGLEAVDLEATDGAALAITSGPTVASVLTLRNSTLETGVASGLGGLVFVENANVTIEDSVLDDGSATSGGAVYATNDGAARNFVIRRTEVNGSFASEAGGGLYGAGFQIDFDALTVTGNTAAAGGGVYTDDLGTGEDLVIDNGSTFSGNSATGGGTSAEALAGLGSALFARQDVMTLREVGFDDNTGVSGTAWVEGASLFHIETTFDGNSVTADVGGLAAILTGDVDIDVSTFQSNSAAAHAGGAWLDAANVVVTESVFADNSSTGTGGGLYVANATVSVEDSTFRDNEAGTGAGLHRTGADSELTVTASAFFRNQADDGGGLWADGLLVLDGTRNFFCENSAGTPGMGGAVYASGVAGSTASFRNEAGSDNLGVNGGVYRLESFDSLDIGYSTFIANEATGGGILSTTIDGATTITHTAGVDTTGPAFDSTGTGTLVVGSSALSGNLPGDFSGTWAATAPTDPVAITTTPVVNNHPGSTCEDTRLYPAIGSDLLDVGPNADDFDNSLDDVGISGGPDSDFFLFLDADGDGFRALDDCDDDNPDSNPDAPDICNGIDDDCDGELDEDPSTEWFDDLDGDGYGSEVDAGYPIQCDAPSPTAVSNNADCDDDDPAVNPDGEEVCDTVDNDCNGIVDDEANDAVQWFEDLDFDGFGTVDAFTLACEAPIGFTDVTGDCDDTLANVYPGAPENCDTLDNDCDGEVDNDALDAPAWYPDADHDGFGVEAGEVIQCLAPLDHSPFAGDCDDTDEFRSPGASELCDGIDNDCDGTTDVDPDSPVYFPDADGDGYGDSEADPVGSCTPVPGLLLDDSDCDDTNPDVNPDAPETCDGTDEDCDGDIDNDPTDGEIFYLDSDRDGFGDSDFELIACFQPVFGAVDGGDCNDDNDVQFPGNTEICDSWDNDCDGDVDEPDAEDALTWYADQDQDGYGDDNQTQVACNAPIGHVPIGGDCADTNPTSHPGRAEICDGVDNDCNGQVDGPDAQNVQFFFEDADGDGFGNPLSELGACSLPDGYTTNDQDCDDDNPDANPTQPEIPGNGIDEDCNGSDLPEGSDTDTDTEDDKQCSCSSTSGGIPVAFIGMLGALFIRRRR